ncbi:MAG: hydroxyacylglutathione hydrolase [Wenzhouxiangella sp.]|nr:MAG: hydroxyacylglutathione hydrolase [Wenzhouxiangella sp.]
MPLHIEAIPALETNYIWAVHDDEHCLIVDPGSSAEVLDFLHQRKLALCALLLTHHHHDHIGGADDLLSSGPVPVWGPADPRMPQVNHPVREGDRVPVPELDLDFGVLETPGHTSSHIVFHDERSLLAGDTLFSVGCGRLFEGTPQQMQDSLDKIARLDPDLQVYCAHEYTADNCRFALAVEPDNNELRQRAREVERLRAEDRITLPTRLGEELATNPFLRTREPEVIASARRRDPDCGEQPADVFTVLRRWKDGF